MLSQSQPFYCPQPLPGDRSRSWPRWGDTLGQISCENILSSLTHQHAALFERPCDPGARYVVKRCECGNLIRGTLQEKCGVCRNRDRCRQAYRQTVTAPPQYGRLKSPWEGN